MDDGLRNSYGNNKKLRIPAYIRIYVTGQRTLASEQLIRECVKSVIGNLDKMLRNMPHTFVVISPLAKGADRLEAREMLDWNTGRKSHVLKAVTLCRNYIGVNEGR